MSVGVVVLLIVLGLAALAAIAGTVVLVVRDGRGEIPVEPPAKPWTAGTLPSVPYSMLRKV
ncbi:hypothetical protein ARTHROSP310_32870 [Arthrobacter sp. AD-310]